MVKQDFKNNPVIGMSAAARWKLRETSPSGQNGDGETWSY